MSAKKRRVSAKFFFFSKSAAQPPGAGVNESLGGDDISKYAELQAIPNWRRVLSNFHEGEFEFKGLRYRTAEHAFQGAKICLANKARGRRFAVESGSALALGDGECARKSRKLVMLTSEQLELWDSIKHNVMEEIWEAKFTQVDHAKEVLLATRDAQLWHGSRGIPNSRQLGLEHVRERLLKFDA